MDIQYRDLVECCYCPYQCTNKDSVYYDISEQFMPPCPTKKEMNQIVNWVLENHG